MSRKPEYILKGLIKNTAQNSRGHRLGAAWLNDNGSISIALNPFVVIEGSDDDIVLTLFPNTPFHSSKEQE
jgi:hypothetical protein